MFGMIHGMLFAVMAKLLHTGKSWLEAALRAFLNVCQNVALEITSNCLQGMGHQLQLY